jgi:hypothetical protein
MTKPRGNPLLYNIRALNRHAIAQQAEAAARQLAKLDRPAPLIVVPKPRRTRKAVEQVPEPVEELAPADDEITPGWFTSTNPTEAQEN